MSDHPKISIISTVYNTGPYLRPAVESILAQTFTDFELLLVDDGSPDDTGTLCDTLAAEDPRVRALHRPNGGAGAASNTGLDAARGDWVLFLDADDVLLPGLWAALAALSTGGHDPVRSDAGERHDCDPCRFSGRGSLSRSAGAGQCALSPAV